jgi:hypothetical protein
MSENETREPYVQPELIKLGDLKELTFEEPCWTCSGALIDPFA